MSDDATTDKDRRPISQRSTVWAQAMTRWLVASSITPNQISAASVVVAALGGISFALSGLATGWERTAFLIGGALGCQLRLLCNMLDGMVAVEGKKGSRDGALWNEIPDRFADVMLLVGAGYGAAFAGAVSPSLGWAAAVFAVLTAYVREAGRGAGAPADFSGPMAKPHRMFVMTCASVLSLFEGEWTFRFADWQADIGNGRGMWLALGLWIVALGAAFTTFRRAWRALQFLRKQL